MAKVTKTVTKTITTCYDCEFYHHSGAFDKPVACRPICHKGSKNKFIPITGPELEIPKWCPL